MMEFLQQIIKEAGVLALSYYKEGIAFKDKSSPGDLITEADTAVSDFLVKKIQAKYPEHGIISEELEDIINPNAEYIWVMDPIDGTWNFAAHVPIWCVMIGIEKNGEPFMGAIYDPIQNELYYAEVGKGAFLNGRQIHVNDKSELAFSSVILCPGRYLPGNPYSSEDYPHYFDFTKNLMGDQGFWFAYYRCMISLCYLAKGSVDSVVNNACLYHDYLAGYVIASEAGAKITNCHGEPWKKGMKDMVAANPKMHPNLMKLF